jgi:Uma2 family endonuclease
MPATALLTSDQFSALPDEFDQNGNRIRQELISGELVRMPPSTQVHNLVKINVLELLLPFGLSNPQLGVRVLAEMAYVVTPNDTLVPDASVIQRSRLSPGKQEYILGAPDLAIEVVSRTDTAANLKSKVDAYLRSGPGRHSLRQPVARYRLGQVRYRSGAGYHRRQESGRRSLFLVRSRRQCARVSDVAVGIPNHRGRRGPQLLHALAAGQRTLLYTHDETIAALREAPRDRRARSQVAACWPRPYTRCAHRQGAQMVRHARRSGLHRALDSLRGDPLARIEVIGARCWPTAR